MSNNEEQQPPHVEFPLPVPLSADMLEAIGLLEAGEPLPVDLVIKLTAAGVDVVVLADSFNL